MFAIVNIYIIIDKLSKTWRKPTLGTCDSLTSREHALNKLLTFFCIVVRATWSTAKFTYFVVIKPNIIFYNYVIIAVVFRRFLNSKKKCSENLFVKNNYVSFNKKKMFVNIII